jgi:integrase
MITENQIKAAIRNAPASGKRSTQLTDDGERGAGRLALLIRPVKNRIVAEWYAVYHRDGKRVTTKISTYPTLSLAEARKEFRERFAPVISTGGKPDGAHARKPADTRGSVTVRELFEAYIADLERAGKRSVKLAQRILLTGSSAAANAIGGDRPASEIEPNDIVPHLAKIHDRGAIVMASQVRAYIGAAFAFGMASAHDYTRKSNGADWGITSNPVLAIRADSEAHRTRDRYLSPAEFRAFWEWLEKYDAKSRLSPALRLMLSTGQRVEEILRIGFASRYLPAQKMLHWDMTKNGKPHTIPLPAQASAILDAITPSKAGLYFPHRHDASRPALYAGVEAAIGKFIAASGVPHFTARDCRRSWKTLAGEAGINKDFRDRIQNHSKGGDVSSRNYDRWSYLPEKTSAMATWSAFLDRILAGELDARPTADVVSIARSAA